MLPASPTAVDRRQALLRDVRRLARRYRRWVGATLVGLSVLLALNALAPPPAPTVTVALATDDLAAGTVLSAEHVAAAQVAAESAPSSPVAPTALLGQVLAGPVVAGEQLTRSRLRGDTLLAGTPPGTVALPVRVADPGAASLVAAGDRIDLLAAVGMQTGIKVTVVGSDLRVLLAGGQGTPARPQSTGPLGSVANGDDLLGGLLVVAASPAQARAIVAGAAEAPLWLVLTQPDE